MFDNSLLDLAELPSADDATVVAAITGWARAEAAASARRLAAIAELVHRRAVAEGDERAHWSCDYWDAAAAEVGAAQGVTHGIASSQLRLSLSLRDRLPRVAALLADGTISFWLARAIASRTDLIQDDDAARRVDEALARDVTRWGPLSLRKTEEAIDALVDRHDPGALRRTRAAARGRNVEIGAADEQYGTAPVWGSLYATDAAVLDRRLMQMAHGVCEDDPRTISQRRADALGALAAGAEGLACGCGRDDCPAADSGGQRRAEVVIHVVAEQAALDAVRDPAMCGETGRRAITSDMTLREALAPDPEPASVGPSVAALIVGRGVIPTPLLAELVNGGAKTRTIRHPGPAVPPELRYRPSTALDEFVRCRDLTCRFPGCDVPADRCDLDHTVAYDDGGPTHPSNLKCLCKKHHLLKTFWVGAEGWADRQLADGTVMWTAPTGHTYTTRPGSRILFPTLSLPTGDLPPPPPRSAIVANRGAMMPTRRRTRARDRANRIRIERVLNDAHVAERNEPPPF